MRLVIGITGASGVQYGIRLAEVLQGKAETYLITTKTAALYGADRRVSKVDENW